jgi:hypothetical protein
MKLVPLFFVSYSHFFQGVRNRASPARLVKHDSSMTPEQRKMIEDINFGGLLQI